MYQTVRRPSGRPFFLYIEKRPENEGPGACGGTDMMTYYFRHWLPRYGITPGLPIVLRYRRTKPLPSGVNHLYTYIDAYLTTSLRIQDPRQQQPRLYFMWLPRKLYAEALISPRAATFGSPRWSPFCLLKQNPGTRTELSESRSP